MLNRFSGLTYRDSGTAPAGIPGWQGGGWLEDSAKAIHAVGQTIEVSLNITFQTWEVGGEVDVPFSDMGKYLDYRLKQVAELRQVTIWTARSWRDSGSKKWHDALAAVERENEKRKAKSLPQLGCFH